MAQSIQELVQASLLCGALSRSARPNVIGFFFFRGSLVTLWEAPGGIGSSSGGWPTIFFQYFDAVGPTASKY